MSNWVAKRQQEAFLLYQAYIAITLHLKPGSEFDFGLYDGARVNIKKETFLADREKMSKFVSLSAGIPEDDLEKFVFANARSGIDIVRNPKRDCLLVFEKWKTNYSMRENMFKHSAIITKGFYFTRGIDTPLDIVMAIIDSGRDDGAIESVISMLHLKPDIVPLVSEKVKENAIWELYWNKLLRIRSMYYAFEIL